MTFGKAITLLSSDQPPSAVQNGTVKDFSRKKEGIERQEERWDRHREGHRTG